MVLSSCWYQTFISALAAITSTKFFLVEEVLLKIGRVRRYLVDEQNY